MRSQRQWRYLFANDMPFARRWARETPGGEGERFRDLPERVARKSKSAARRLGLLDPAEMERAEKAGERIAGQLCRSATGRFVNCNSPQATQESKDKLRKIAADQKKQERQAERDTTRRGNEKAVGEQSGLGSNLSDALLEFASPDESITLAPQNADALLEKGLIEQNPDGSYRISGAGRSYVAAARSGDVSRARDALGRGNERTARRAEVAARRAEREARRRAKEQEKKQPKKGGGGGKGKEEKPKQSRRLRIAGPAGSARPARGGGSSGGSRATPEPKQTATPAEQAQPSRQQDRAATGRDTAQQVGLSTGDYSALRAAAEGRGGNAATDALGLTADGEATDQGRRALTALERGDTRQYQAALQDARARREREQTREKVKRTHGYWKTYRKARADGLMPLEARKVAREQVLQAKAQRAVRERNRLMSAIVGIR